MLQSLMARRAEKYGFGPATGTLFACATGLVTDAAAVRALSRQPTLCFEPSAKGQELVKALRQEVNLYAFSLPVGWPTVTQFLAATKSDDQAFDLLKSQVQNRLLYTRPFPNVRREVDEVRTLPSDQFLCHRWAGERVLTDLQERGRLYWDGRLPYAFLHDTKEVIVGESDNQDFQPLAAQYGIASTDHGHVRAPARGAASGG